VRFLNSKADIARRLGQPAKAYQLHQQALDVATAFLGPRSLLVAGSHDRLGKVALEQGKVALAERHFRTAVDIASTSSANQTEPMANLAGVTKDPREALTLARASVANSRARRASLFAGGSGAQDAQAAARATALDRVAADPRSYPYLRLVEVAWKASALPGQDKPTLRNEAFLAAQDAYLSRAAQAMARTAVRGVAGKGKLGDLVRQQQDLTGKIALWQDRQLSAIGKGEDEAARRYFALIEEGGKKLAQIDAEIDKRFPDFRAMLNPAPMAIGEVARALKPDEGLLVVVNSLDGVTSFAIGPAGSTWHRASLTKAEIDAIQRRLLCQLDEAMCSDQKSAQGSRRQYDLQGAYRLYTEIVRPVESVLSGVKRLYVVSQGEFARLPLNLLPTSVPARAGATADLAAMAGSGWLVDRHAMITLPSVASLRLLGKDGRSAAQAFIGYGAPVLRGSPPDQAGFARTPIPGLADVELLQSLKPLPGTAEELAAQAASLGSNARAVRLGAAATEAAVRADKALGQARVITFATHSLMAGELEGYNEPGLVFTPPKVPTARDDGILSASEAATLSLHADWVILSACNTASGAEGAEALSGLARGFLFAGARALLVSHWGLKDQATAALTVEALREDRELSRGMALQAAMKTMRTGKRSDGTALASWRPHWAHPAYWAGFSLIANADQ
jgi:CHAT domain-containing protein